MRFLSYRAVCAVFLGMISGVFCVGCQIGTSVDDGGAEPQRVDLNQPEEKVFLGNVTFVNEKSRFVLVKTPVNQRLKPGMPLQSFRDGQLSGELRFSPEQAYGFMSADIAEGTPLVGDEVYLRHTGDFDVGISPRMQQAVERQKREREMGFFEKRKYEREKKRRAKAKGKGREG